MTYGRKTGGRDIKKGQVLNPNGRPRLSSEEKAMRKLTATHFNKVANKYVLSTVAQLEAKFRDVKTPALDLILIKILIEAADKGDIGKINFFLERLIGKVPDKIIDETEDRTLNIKIKEWQK